MRMMTRRAQSISPYSEVSAVESEFERVVNNDGSRLEAIMGATARAAGWLLTISTRPTLNLFLLLRAYV